LPDFSQVFYKKRGDGMPKTRIFQYGYGLLLIFLIILVGMKINVVFRPLVILVQTLFFPFLAAGVLYYLFRPLVQYLQSKNISRPLAILLIYLIAGTACSITVHFAGPILQKQLKSLIEEIPAIIGFIQEKINDFQHSQYKDGANSIAKGITSNMTVIGSKLFSFVGVVAGLVTVAVTVPFILYYMLKEGEKAPKRLLLLLPPAQREHGHKILVDLDEALSSYIYGQIFVSFCLGVMLYIGYVSIGLNYSLLLAILAMVTNVIPFLGPIISIIPAIIIAIFISPMMVMKVLLVMVICQQIDGHFISPQVMGRKLEIHPLTIISLLLAAGSIGGVAGLILAVPVYAVLKVIAHHSYRLWKLRKEQTLEEKIMGGED
jgi:predicted PurR-regulated permease PerM